MLLVLLFLSFHCCYCCQLNYFQRPSKSQGARDCPPKEILPPLCACRKKRGHSMGTDGEILGNTSQCSVSISDHHWPTRFQAFGRCYRKEKRPEAICKRTINGVCRCSWQAHSSRVRWMGKNTEAFVQKLSKAINRQQEGADFLL